MKDEQQQLILIEEGNTNLLPMARNEQDGLHGQKAIDMQPNVLRNVIKVAVGRAFLTLGKSVSKNDATFIVDGLVAEVMRSFGGIRDKEILLAIYKGSVGEYISIEKIYTLSLSVFVSFIRAYMTSDERANAAKLYTQSVLKLEAPTRPSDEELAKMTRQNVLNAFDFFKRNGYYYDYGNSIFRALDFYGGILNFTEEQKVTIWKQARHNVFAEYGRQCSSPQVDRRNEAKRTIQELKAKKDHQFFWIEAQKIALNILFKEFSEANITLEDMLN